MPTPFQHLTYAQALLEERRLPRELHNFLQEHAAAFTLGNVAADVQAVTGQPRFETHFYHLPPPTFPRAGEKMLAQYPELAAPYALSPAHAAFISGYLAHLVYDEVWAWVVFIPFYFNSDLWPDRLTFSVHHNGLRVLLDRKAQVSLFDWPAVADLMKAANPDHWLPFVKDSALREWRDWILDQLIHPGKVETTEVFAARMGVSVTYLEDVVARMRDGRYPHPVPGLEQAVARFESQARQESCVALCDYWSGQYVPHPCVPDTVYA